ncbi:MAG: acyl-CoA dehydrogenase, partial [Pseudonocardiales bacterium]
MSGRNTRGRDLMGAALAALNKLAGTGLLDRLRLRTPAEKVVYQASRTGFTTQGVASRTFASLDRRGKPARLPNSGERSLFDLNPTDEQLMIVAATAEFAAEQLRP